MSFIAMTPPTNSCSSLNSSSPGNDIAMTFIGWVVVLMMGGALACSDAPRKPAGVPKDARWAGAEDGGHFIRCAVRRNADECEIYDDETGRLW